MSVRSAVGQILKDMGNPLNANQFVELIVEAGFWELDGKIS